MPRPDGAAPESAERLRFRGLSASSRAFFTALENEPCPSVWTGSNRIAYAAHVLSPLKAFVIDLARLLADVEPRLALEPRIGGSLFWTGNPALPPEDCPVRVVRTWDAAGSPESSPILSATFHGSAIEIGAANDPAGIARSPYPTPCEELALAARGWTVEPGRRVQRSLRWERWLDDPDLVREVADAFRELMPLLRAMDRPADDGCPVAGDGGIEAPR